MTAEQAIIHIINELVEHKDCELLNCSIISDIRDIITECSYSKFVKSKSEVDGDF